MYACLAITDAQGMPLSDQARRRGCALEDEGNQTSWCRRMEPCPRGISVIVLDGRSTSFDDLAILMPDVLTAVDALHPGQLLHWCPMTTVASDGYRRPMIGAVSRLTHRRKLNTSGQLFTAPRGAAEGVTPEGLAIIEIYRKRLRQGLLP